MTQTFKVIGMAALALSALFIIGFLATGADLATFRFWAPRYENAKREVFENSQSYVQGKIEYLSKLRFQYQESDPGGAHQSAIRTLILGEAATVDNHKLPMDLQGFIANLKVTQ